MADGELHFDIELVTKDNASDKPIRIAGTGIFFTVTLVECGRLLLPVSLAGAISTLFDFHCRFLTWPSALTEFYRQLLDSLCLLLNRIKALYLLVGNQSPCQSIRLYLLLSRRLPFSFPLTLFILYNLYREEFKIDIKLSQRH